MIRNMFYVLIVCAIGAAYANREALMAYDWSRITSLGNVKVAIPTVNPDCKLARPQDCLQKAK